MALHRHTAQPSPTTDLLTGLDWWRQVALAKTERGGRAAADVHSAGSRLGSDKCLGGVLAGNYHQKVFHINAENILRYKKRLPLQPH